MLVCAMAAKLPISIDRIATKTTIWRQSPTSEPSGSTSTRTSSAIAASLGAAAKNAVTGVGAPSYTSGVHIWKGAADTLKASAAETNTMPNTTPIGAPPA